MTRERTFLALVDEMRQLLVEMTLIQYGSTVRWNANGNGIPESRPPSGESYSMADKWLAEWTRLPGRETVDKAREELDQWRRRSSPPPESSSLEEWVIQDGEGYSVEQVASKFRLAENRVRRIRLRAGRDAEFGKVQFGKPFEHVRQDLRDRVLNLHAQGCTLRQIEMQTGISKSSVQRWIRDSACVTV